MLPTTDYETMFRIVHRTIFPTAVFVKAVNLELLIRIDSRASVGNYKVARKNILFLFPNCVFNFRDGSHIEIETGVTIDHKGNMREIKRDD